MNHLIVAPIVIPALGAGLLLALHRAPLGVARAAGVIFTFCGFAAAAALFVQALDGTPAVYAVGGWPAPFGIVLVADRLSALMVLLAAMLSLAALVYALHGWDARGRFFHVFFQFQLMGLNGAFLTGDLFNLFVFFEVMLIASYCLALHGLGRERLRATLHYVAVNLTASGVFLVAVSLLYGVTGTLNMAHLAERIAEAPAQDIALVRTGGLLLIGVFCVKAALFPLYFWLPAAYSHAAAPVAALFSIMTKVGVYAIVRVTTLLYGAHAGEAGDLTSPWLLPLALITLTLAALGALGAQRLATMVAYLTIASVGTMLIAIAAGGTPGLSAAIYYLAHSTVVIGALFLVADLIGRQRGEAMDSLHPGPRIAHAAVLGLAFLAATATVAGVPPFSGFIAKLMVLTSVQNAPQAVAAWAVVLGTSFLVLVGGARAGSRVLWNVQGSTAEASAHPPRAGEWLGVGLLIACGALLVVFAAPMKSYADETAAQLARATDYVQAVLGTSAREGLVRTLPNRDTR